MIAAHGANVTLGDSTLTINYTPLLTALSLTGQQELTIDITAVTGVKVHAPTSLSCGAVELTGESPTRITFSPNQEKQADRLAADIQSILKGEAPTQSTHPGVTSAEASNPSVIGFDLVGFDVETANADSGSICQIGLVRYKDGQEVDAVSWLCAPPESLNYFEKVNIGIHGITPEQVEDAPTFAELLPQMVEFVGELPLVAHNAQFDFTALSRACVASGIEVPVMTFGCSLALARNEKLQVANHKLPTVASTLGVELKNHHDATEDARACAGITIALARRHEFEGGFIDFIHGRGFTVGSIDSEKVYPVLRDRSGANVAVQRRKLGLDTPVGFPAGTPAGTPVAAPGPILAVAPASAESPEPAEKKSRPAAPWAKVSTPDTIPDPNPDADPSGILFGHNVTLTGDFEPYEKGALWQRIADQGGQVGKNVTKKTTILVAGQWTTITSKQKRAEELIEKGQDIQIWDDKQLFTALGLDDQPPF